MVVRDVAKLLVAKLLVARFHGFEHIAHFVLATILQVSGSCREYLCMTSERCRQSPPVVTSSDGVALQIAHMSRQYTRRDFGRKVPFFHAYRNWAKAFNWILCKRPTMIILSSLLIPFRQRPFVPWNIFGKQGLCDILPFHRFPRYHGEFLQNGNAMRQVREEDGMANESGVYLRRWSRGSCILPAQSLLDRACEVPVRPTAVRYYAKTKSG